MEYDLCERSDFTVRSADLYTQFLLALHRIKKNIPFLSFLCCVKHTFLQIYFKLRSKHKHKYVNYKSIRRKLKVWLSSLGNKKCWCLIWWRVNNFRNFFVCTMVDYASKVSGGHIWNKINKMLLNRSEIFTYVVKFCALGHAHCITWQNYLKVLFADIDVNTQSLVESNQYEVSLVCNISYCNISVNSYHRYFVLDITVNKSFRKIG
jgi:hypothetical protein